MGLSSRQPPAPGQSDLEGGAARGGLRLGRSVTLEGREAPDKRSCPRTEAIPSPVRTYNKHAFCYLVCKMYILSYSETSGSKDQQQSKAGHPQPHLPRRGSDFLRVHIHRSYACIYVSRRETPTVLPVRDLAFGSVSGAFFLLVGRHLCLRFSKGGSTVDGISLA